jgi:hypothetical protein
MKALILALLSTFSLAFPTKLFGNADLEAALAANEYHR